MVKVSFVPKKMFMAAWDQAEVHPQQFDFCSSVSGLSSCGTMSVTEVGWLAGLSWGSSPGASAVGRPSDLATFLLRA